MHPRFFVKQKMAGLAGLEPANDGTKTRCLTTWRQPIVPYILAYIFHFVNVGIF